MNVDEAVLEVRETAGLGATPSQALRWLNSRHKRFVVEAEWGRATVSLGSTIANTAEYDWPAEIAVILGLSVGDIPYEPEGRRTLARLRSGRYGYTARKPTWVQTFNASKQRQISLYPPPSEVLPIVAAVIAYPDDIAAGGEFAIPEDFHQELCDGAIADGKRRLDEDTGEAAVYEDRFGAAVERLRRRQFTGRGPYRVKVEGRTGSI